MKHLMNRANAVKLSILASVILPGLVLAQTTSQYSGLVAAANWDDAKTDIITVFGAIAGLVVVFTGAYFILKALRGK